jgi:hypothetical protein
MRALPSCRAATGPCPDTAGTGTKRDNDRCANEGANVDTNANANADADTPPLFRRASQNLTAAAMLPRGCPKAATSKERWVCQQLKVLLEAAAAQQAESSTSRQALATRASRYTVRTRR